MRALIFAFVVLIGASCAAQEFRRAETLEDVWKASFRVETNNARGSGAFFAARDGKCYVLTNYHVVEKAQTVNLSHWGTNERKTIPARVVWRCLSERVRADFAVCEVDAADMARLDAPYIPLAGRDCAPDQQSYIASSGCPDGRFAQAWKGKTLGRYDDVVRFQPAPVEGQSGSAIVSEIDGELWITGVLTYRTGEKGSDSAEGLAIPISNLYQAAATQLPTSDEVYTIPSDWHECALKWELYTRNGCAPCVTAESNAIILETNGIGVERVRYEKEPARFDERNVDATPTWILSDGSKRIIGASTVERLTAAFNSAKLTEPSDAPKPAAPYVAPDDNLDATLEAIEPIDLARRSVRESDSRTSKLLDDADSFFSKRERKSDESTPDYSDQKLGTLGAAVCDRIEGFINKQFDEAEKRVDAKIDEVSKRAATTWKQIRLRVFLAAFLSCLLSVWTADFIKGGLKKAWGVAVAAIDLAKIQAEAARQAAREAVEKYKTEKNDE